MGLWNAIKSTGKKIARGFAIAAECTLQVCSEVAHATATVCENVASTIRGWINPDPGPDPIIEVLEPIKPYYEPIIKESGKKIKEQFPTGVKNSCKQLNAEERVKKLAELADHAGTLLGIKNKPKVKFFIPDNPEETFTSYGSYNFRDNTLKLNLPMIVSGEPELLHEQVSTVFHELIHARQHLAIEAFAEGRSVAEFGYTDEYVAILAENYLNYISPRENYEAYIKQPLEAEAYYFEQQLKQLYN